MNPTRIYVAACGGRKLPHAAPAGELYTGSSRFIIDAVRAEAGRRDGAPFRILSALHGLVAPEQLLDPYDVRMSGPGAITAEQLAEQVAELAGPDGATFVAFLPKAYRRQLEAAAALVTAELELDPGTVTVADMFADAPGIGYQRGVAAALNRAGAVPGASAVPVPVPARV